MTRQVFAALSALALAAIGAALGAALGVALAAPAQTAFKAQVKYAQVGEVKLAYYVRGEGKPLLMVNGFISTMSLWDPALLEALSAKRQLILFDNRGVGLSTDTAQNNTTIPQMADDAAGLIKALGLQKPDVLGWSMGARIVQQLVVRHPEAVNKVVLAAANPGGSHAVPADKAVEEQLNDASVPLEGKLALVFPPEAGGEQAARDIFGRIVAATKDGSAPPDLTVSKETTLRQDRARTTLWTADEENFVALAAVKNPVLVTGGRYDVIDKPVNSLIIARQIPFAWLAFFDGGHAFLFQQPTQFAETVEAFLQ